MNSITRNNYEIFFIDYFDKKLSEKQEEELFLFLEANPDLKFEFDMFSGIKAEPDVTIGFSHKERLKKNTITLFNYKSWFVGLLEGDLSPIQKSELNSFLEINPELKPELEILKQTKLYPDHSITFSNRKILKKQGRILQMHSSFRSISAIAAMVTLILISWFFIKQMKQSNVFVNDEVPKIDQREKLETLQPLQAENGSNDFKSAERVPDTVFRRENSNKKKVLKPVEPVFANQQPKPKEEVASPGKPYKQNDPSIAATGIKPKQTARPSQNFTPGLDTLPPFALSGNTEAKKLTLSDIFSEDELKELGVDASGVQQKQITNSIGSFAKRELKKAAGLSDIELSKQVNITQQTVTYALEVGSKFSVTHITARR